jgi:hypothetical protein
MDVSLLIAHDHNAAKNLIIWTSYIFAIVFIFLGFKRGYKIVSDRSISFSKRIKELHHPLAYLIMGSIMFGLAKFMQYKDLFI